VVLEAGAEEISFIAIPIVAFMFYGMSYRSTTLNHFLAVFLVVVKVSVLVIIFFAQNGMIRINTSLLFWLPILLGAILGCIGCIVFNNYILLLCVSYIGATELVPKIMDLINGTLFAATGDFGHILSLEPTEIILSFLGIDIPSPLEIILIMIIFVGSFYLQMYIVKRQGIDLSKAILDDTGDKVKIIKVNKKQ